MIFKNIQNIIIVSVFSFILFLLNKVNKLNNKVNELTLINKQLISTKQIQENVIDITDQNIEKNKKLDKEIQNKISKIKNDKPLNQEEFINEASNVFNNFGKYE